MRVARGGRVTGDGTWLVVLRGRWCHAAGDATRRAARSWHRRAMCGIELMAAVLWLKPTVLLVEVNARRAPWRSVATSMM